MERGSVRRGYKTHKTIAAPLRTNQVSQGIRLPHTTFVAVVVNVNKHSVSKDARAFMPNYRFNLLALFLFAFPGSIYCYLFSLICFGTKFSNYLPCQYLLFYINQIINQMYLYLILNAQLKVKSQRDYNDNLLVNSLKVWQVTKQNVTQGTEQRCSVKHDSKLSSRNSLLLPPPSLPLPQKKNMKRLGATIVLSAWQKRSGSGCGGRQASK